LLEQPAQVGLVFDDEDSHGIELSVKEGRGAIRGARGSRWIRKDHLGGRRGCCSSPASRPS